VRIWDLANGQMERTLQGYALDAGEPRGSDGGVTGVAVTPDGHRIVWGVADRKSLVTGQRPQGDYVGTEDCTLYVWDFALGREIASWTPDLGVGVSACCTVLTDASLFVYGDSAGHVHVLRLL